MVLTKEDFQFIKENDSQYKSQVGQDIIVDHILNKKIKGFFVDVGAHNGVSFSNTYFFEKYRDWRGICIEPMTKQFELLQATRSEKTIKINDCVSDLADEKVDFIEVEGGVSQTTELEMNMYSCLEAYSSEKHVDEIAKMTNKKGQLKKIECFNIRLNYLLGVLGVRNIDLLSIDVEGGEYQVLQSIDYKAYHINVITVEENSNKDKIDRLLKENNFELLCFIGGLDLVYVNKNLLI